VFQRAGVCLRHTEGFNPHPYMSFALPLPVGVESVCELLDFDLAEETAIADLPERLNVVMPEGIRAVHAYTSERKFADIAFTRLRGRLVYDAGVCGGLAEELSALFKNTELVVSKKTKKGMKDFDLAPHIKAISFSAGKKDELAVDAIVAAQNPSVSPEQLVAAIRTRLPHSAPDFAAFRRIEVFDREIVVFR
jgi:radical SAM-linked protein